MNHQLKEIVQKRAVKHGQFTLSSGLTSNHYIDLKEILHDGYGLNLIASQIYGLLGHPHKIDSIGGMEIGAIYIATAVSYESEWATDSPIRSFTIRKESKDHDSQKRIEGFCNGNVIIVDDVVTTGNSIIQSIEEARKVGAKVVGAFSIVDRLMGAKDAIEALGVPYLPLLTVADLELTS